MNENRLRGADAACKCLNRLEWAELPVEPLDLFKRLHRMVMLVSYEEIAAMDGGAAEALQHTAPEAEGQTFRAQTEDGRHEMLFILYRESGHPGRARHTVAHELGHVVLGHAGESPANDAQAEAFAAALLCPPGLPALLRKELGPALTADALAALCGISREAARLALHGEDTPAVLPSAEEAARRLLPAALGRARHLAIAGPARQETGGSA